MNIQLGWASVAVIISVVGHAFFTIWSAATFKATISSKIDNLVNAMLRMDKELEKRDIQITAMWKKVDGLNERITRAETKCNLEHSTEGD